MEDTMKEDILVFDRKFLKGFKESDYQGFYDRDENLDWFKHVLGNSFFHPRNNELEKNDSLLQIIPYFSVCHHNNLLMYERSGSEDRLHKLTSIGFGGHVSSVDFKKDMMETLRESIRRESLEELGIQYYKHMVDPFAFCHGFLYSPEEGVVDVNAVHFGICFNFAIFDSDKDHIKFSDESKLESWVNLEKDSPEGLEKWSKIFWERLYDFNNKG